MAINPGASYPAGTEPGTGYPYSKAKNVSAPGAGDGFPWEKAFVNDLFGFLQSLLVSSSITPSGDPDRVGESQYLDALTALFPPTPNASLVQPGKVQLSNDTSSTSDALAATIGALNAMRALSVPVLAVGSTAARWSVKVGKLKIQGGTISAGGGSAVTVDLTTSPSTAYTLVHLAFMPWINTASPFNDNPLGGTVVNLSSGSVRNRGESTTNVGYISIGFDS